MTEEEVKDVGDSGTVESVTLHQPEGSEGWTAAYDGVGASGMSKSGVLEDVASKLREREE